MIEDTDSEPLLEEELRQEETEYDDDPIGDNIFEDLKNAAYQARYSAPFVSLLLGFLAWGIAVFPYRGTMNRNKMLSVDELKQVRPLLTDDEKTQIRCITAGAETEFLLPGPSYDYVTLRTFTKVAVSERNYEAPQLFYDGVVFGLTSSNPHELMYTSSRKPRKAEKKMAKDDLLEHIQTMNPKPTSIMERITRYNATDWLEEGFGIYFSYADLDSQGKLSGDVTQPWKRVLVDILDIAREFKQVYVTLWYPYTFGHHDETVRPVPETEKNKFKVIIRQIEPTRTGLDDIKSKAVVWLSARNKTDIVAPLSYYRQPWTEQQPESYS